MAYSNGDACANIHLFKFAITYNGKKQQYPTNKILNARRDSRKMLQIFNRLEQVIE